MKSAPSILIASDAADDAELISKLLSEEFGNVWVSTINEKAIQDFGHYKPGVLILAFYTLKKAEHYYLGLYRLGPQIDTIQHRTIVLCAKEELKDAYELCKKGYFDDYVFFWPASYDAFRLRMAVHQAFKHLSTLASPSKKSELISLSNRISLQEESDEKSLASGIRSFTHFNDSVEQAKKEVGVVLNSAPFYRDDQSLQRVIKSLNFITENLQPFSSWLHQQSSTHATRLDSARQLKTLALSIDPNILIIEDDEFQQKLMEKVFHNTPVQLHFASSGVEALAKLTRIHPNLILMDLNLPDTNGIELTKNLKSNTQFSDLPIIMITGQSERDSVIQSLQAGVSDFIVKPIDKMALKEKLSKFINVDEIFENLSNVNII